MRVVGVVLWFVASLRVTSDCSSAPRSRRQFRSHAPPPQASLSLVVLVAQPFENCVIEVIVKEVSVGLGPVWTIC